MQTLDNQIWRSHISTSTKLKLHNTCILPIFLYGSDCWAVSRTDARKIDAFVHHFVIDSGVYECYQMALICSKRRGPEANRTTQTHCNSPVTSPDRFWAHCAYGHRCQADPVNSPSRGLEETSRTPRITWLMDLRSHNLTLPEAVDMAQNWSLWRMWSLYVVEASDLNTVSPGNLLCKYADDTYIIIPASNSHTRLAEIEHIESWSKDNNLTLNCSKTVEVIFVDKKTPCPKIPSFPSFSY